MQEQLKNNIIKNPQEDNNKNTKQIFQEIINLAEKGNIEELNKKIKENLEIITSEEWLKMFKNFLDWKNNSNMLEELSEILFWRNSNEKLNILWKIFVLSSTNWKKILEKIRQTNESIEKTLSLREKNYQNEITSLHEIINNQGAKIIELNSEMDKLKHKNKQLSTILKQISALFQIENFEHLPIFLKDFKIKSKKTAEQIKELQKLWVLEITQNNEIVISPKIIAFLKEFETKIITPNNWKESKKLETTGNTIIKAEEVNNHKIKNYKPHKLDKKNESKENELLNQIEELKKQLEEKENKISKLEEKNKTLEQKLSEKEKILEEQNKKIEEIINKLDKVEKKTEENNKPNHNPQAVRAYQEVQQSN